MKLVILLLILLAVLSVADATTLTATVDTVGTTTAFRHNWKKCVGSGHMLLGTRADWRSHPLPYNFSDTPRTGRI